MFFWLSGRFLWSGDIAGACNDYDENKDNDIDSGDYDGHYNDQHSNDVGDEDVFFGCLAGFCGAAILQSLSHHSCACDGVPLLL